MNKARFNTRRLDGSRVTATALPGFTDFPDPFGVTLLPNASAFASADPFGCQRQPEADFAGVDAQKVQRL